LEDEDNIVMGKEVLFGEKGGTIDRDIYLGKIQHIKA